MSLTSSVLCDISTPLAPVEYIDRLPSFNAALDVNRPSFDTFPHWRNANFGRINSSYTNASRDDVRAKARYEYQNNDHFNGIVNSLALNVIGTGARLSFSLDSQIPDRTNKILNQLGREISGKVERKYSQWSKATKLFLQQYQMVISMILDGEALAIIQYNPNTPIVPYQLKSIDPSRLANPNNAPDSEFCKGGIVYDVWGNPEYFCIIDLPQQPYCTTYDYSKYQMVPARQVCHVFVPSFAEQLRGICMVASSMQRLGRLRDYDDAILESAKASSSLIGVIKTQQGYSTPNMTQAFQGTQWQNYATMPMNRNAWMFLPPTADIEITDIKPQSTSYTEFVNENLTAAAHPLQLPKNAATNSSEGYNFSSAKLDEQRAFQFISFLRQLIDIEVNDRLFSIFYTQILEDLILEFPETALDIIPIADDVTIKWRYPLPPDIQPSVRENMLQTMYANGSASLKDIIEYRGNDQDWQTVMDQRATESAYAADMLQKNIPVTDTISNESVQ